MKSLINRIKVFLKDKIGLSKHRLTMFLISFVASVILNMLGCNIISIVVIALFIGTIMEVAYCIVPKKEAKIFGIKFQVIDFKTFKENIDNDNFEYIKPLDEKSIWYIIVGIIAYLVVEIVI